jgi:hypothetical protein
MRKRTRWLLGGLAVGAGAIGAVRAYWKRRNVDSSKKGEDVWARPGMPVTFRAELMPGRDRNKRTFLVKELLWNGRVLLHDAAGEHAEKEFEPVQFDRPAS